MEGERLLREALAAFEAAGSRHWQARALEMLGQAAEGRGAAGEARRWYERALALLLSFSPKDAERLEVRLRSL